MPEASLILSNANVIMLTPRQCRAQAIAIKDGKIMAVGTNREIQMHVGKKTKIIHCKGKTVLPGFVDCHVHMKEFGLFLQQVDLRNAKSIEEMQRILRQHVEKHPEQRWITGGRWDQEKLKEKRYPTRWDLDSAISNKPALLNRVCGHLAVVNSKALRLAGITKHTKIRGGQVELDRSTGQPNGILKDNAIDLVWKIIPRLGKETTKEACVLACKKAVEAGLTGVHWLVSSSEEINILQKMCEDETLPLRINLGIPERLLDHVLALGMSSGFGNEMLKMGFIKILSDGSLGAQTAAMKRPYSDNPRRRGMMLYSRRDLHRIVMKAHVHGWQLGVHAIGDRAIENVLDAYEQALKKAPSQNHRHRIEHCSILNQKLIARMRKLGIVASVQPHFVISDFWTVDRVGPERARWAYPFKTLIEKGVVVASGSDCPVELINPLLGVWAAVAREDNVNESLSVEEALKTYTSNAAYASFDEDKKGTIQNGKLADLTVLSDDPTKISPEKIRDISVEMVIVNGKIVYSKGQSKH
jgi:hypothetical protein